MPITFRLICRKSSCLNYENMCDWPEESVHEFEVSLNSNLVKLHRVWNFFFFALWLGWKRRNQIFNHLIFSFPRQQKRSYLDRDSYEHYEGNDSSVEVSSYIVPGVNKIAIKQCFCDSCNKKMSVSFFLSFKISWFYQFILYIPFFNFNMLIIFRSMYSR